MSTIREVQQGVFDALLLRDSLERLQEQGLAPIVAGDPQPTVNPLAADFSPRIRQQAESMQQVFILLFSLENAIRELISQRLAERHGATWWESKIPTKIREHVAGLQQKETRNRYHARRSTSLIGYTTFGQLVQIMIANWDEFADLFPDQSWLNARLNDLEVSRNIIMHGNTLPEIEVDRISSVVRDWLSQVG